MKALRHVPRFLLAELYLLPILLFIIQMGPVRAYGQQTPSPTQAVDSTLSVALQNTLDEAVQALGLMGASVSIIIPGQGEWLGASGLSDPVAGETIRPDMIFGAGSITKNIVAALVLKLAEEGLLTLEDSLGQWLPAYPNIDGGITIRQLLNHTSGLFDFTAHPAFGSSIRSDFTRVWTPEEVIANFVIGPVFPPGTFQEYSSTNYTLAGMIIKLATGSEVSTALRSRFLDPLNLNSTFLEVEEQVIGELAHGWEDLGGGLEDITPIPRTSLYSAAWTIGAIFANASDIARWGKALFEGQVLSPASLGQMLDFIPIDEYGLGVYRIPLQGRELWGHDGGTIGYTSLMLYEPQDGICISVMLNIGRESLPVPYSDIHILNALLEVVLDDIATGIESPISEVPTAFDLRQNYPNPFNPSTTIEYQLLHPGQVTLTIYNTLGQEVRTLVNSPQTQGTHRVVWDGTNTYGERVASGLYLYRINVGEQIQTRKMMMVQ